jgi:cathepsin D
MDSASANGQTTGRNIDAIIDTGTTLVIGDTNTVAALYQAIPGAQDASQTAGAGFFTCSFISEFILYIHTS